MVIWNWYEHCYCIPLYSTENIHFAKLQWKKWVKQNRTELITFTEQWNLYFVFNLSLKSNGQPPHGNQGPDSDLETMVWSRQGERAISIQKGPKLDSKP